MMKSSTAHAALCKHQILSAHCHAGGASDMCTAQLHCCRCEVAGYIVQSDVTLPQISVNCAGH